MSMPNDVLQVRHVRRRITTDPALTYEPAPFHGTTTIVKRTPPSKGDPFERFRQGHRSAECSQGYEVSAGLKSF